MVVPATPFRGDRKLHDIHRSDPALCAADTCNCPRPRGWVLSRVAIRAVTGWSESVINERSGDLPGRIATSWTVVVDTLVLFREVIYGGFRFRPARRAARGDGPCSALAAAGDHRNRPIGRNGDSLQGDHWQVHGRCENWVDGVMMLERFERLPAPHRKSSHGQNGQVRGFQAR